MIDFSISSVNMAILVSNLFIIFLVLIFRNRKVMFRLGLPLLVGFVILICVRMIFPVELLPISHNVYLPDLLTTIVGETRRVRFFHDTASWWNILEIILMGMWYLIFVVQIHQTQLCFSKICEKSCYCFI